MPAVRLNEGTVENGEVVCPWHGSRFRLSDGAVLGGPATFPQPQLDDSKGRAAAFRFEAAKADAFLGFPHARRGCCLCRYRTASLRALR